MTFEEFVEKQRTEDATGFYGSECERTWDAATQAAEERMLAGGVGLIAAERKRHVSEEGWTPEHDDTHANGELADAAVCYAARSSPMDDWQRAGLLTEWAPGLHVPMIWPRGWIFKPDSGDRIRELVKAGALIAAEIDRLKRAIEVGEK